jgi:hypothetical protein
VVGRIVPRIHPKILRLLGDLQQGLNSRVAFNGYFRALRMHDELGLGSSNFGVIFWTWP